MFKKIKVNGNDEAFYTFEKEESLSMKNLEGVIYYDKQKELYNFPYILEFTNEKIELDYIFHSDNFKNEKEMLLDRDIEVSKQILDKYFMKQFEILQEICLEQTDNNNNELMDEITERLDILYYLFVLINKLNKDKVVKKEENSVLDVVWSMYDELLEMFILLEDLYSGVRKLEIIERKKKYLELENK